MNNIKHTSINPPSVLPFVPQKQNKEPIEKHQKEEDPSPTRDSLHLEKIQNVKIQEQLRSKDVQKEFSCNVLPKSEATLSCNGQTKSFLKLEETFSIFCESMNDLDSEEEDKCEKSYKNCKKETSVAIINEIKETICSNKFSPSSVEDIFTKKLANLSIIFGTSNEVTELDKSPNDLMQAIHAICNAACERKKEGKETNNYLNRFV